MVVNVAELFRAPGTFKELSVETDAHGFSFDDPRVCDDPVAVRVRLESASDGIVVKGTAEARWADQCRRCLCPVGGSIVVEIDDVFLHDRPGRAVAGVAVAATDPEAWRVTEDRIDLAPMVREAVLLALPGAPVCRADCPGLCPDCGADLSEGPCPCRPAPADERWSALDTLRGRLPDDAGQ